MKVFTNPRYSTIYQRNIFILWRSLEIHVVLTSETYNVVNTSFQPMQDSTDTQDTGLISRVIQNDEINMNRKDKIKIIMK